MTPYVWVFPRDGGTGRRKGPENLFTETDMYTIPLPGGGRDLRVEHGLSHLERGLEQLRTEYIERRRQIPEARFVKFIAFIAAMHGRTRSFRDHHREQWRRVLDTGEELEESMKKRTPEERRRIGRTALKSDGPGITMDQVRRVVEMPIQTLMPAVLSAEVPIMSQMVMTIYCTDSKPGFITSDSPVVWFDPESVNRPPLWAGPALMYETIEITMPLSPRHLIAIHHDQPMSRGIKPVKYVDAWDETVKRMNMRTVFHADDSVVCAQDAYDDQWRIRASPVGDDV